MTAFLFESLRSLYSSTSVFLYCKRIKVSLNLLYVSSWNVFSYVNHVFSDAVIQRTTGLIEDVHV